MLHMMFFVSRDYVDNKTCAKSSNQMNSVINAKINQVNRCLIQFNPHTFNCFEM